MANEVDEEMHHSIQRQKQNLVDNFKRFLEDTGTLVVDIDSVD